MKGKETRLFMRVELNKISALGKEISKERSVRLYSCGQKYWQ